MNYTKNTGNLFDAHCHLSPVVTKQRFSTLKEELQKKLLQEPSDGFIFKYPCLNMMSTNFIDYKLVHELSKEFPGFVNPNYGVHPWFCHLYTFVDYSKDENAPLSSTQVKRLHYSSILLPHKDISDQLLEALPVPIYIFDYLKEVEALLQENPLAGIGEIGIDKSFRLPMCGYLGSEQCLEWIDDPFLRTKNPQEQELRHKWSPFRTDMDHQIRVVEAFLDLAKRFRRPVSLHCVGNHGKLFDLLKKVFIDDTSTNNGYRFSSIDLHSYSGSIEQTRMYTRMFPGIKFSISSVLNLKRYRNRLDESLKSGHLTPKNLLLETDLGLDALYWPQKEEDGEDRYELLVSRKTGSLDRHTELLSSTLEQIYDLDSRVSLQTLNDNYREYLNLVTN
ncbi:hypothetical protein FOA43_000429 [Brettanomyces nanus]|uniref:Uncharacterized protein n=1 Tax=Eeniella nana TaxID=13502 RepID=A0A875S118_EENNA|nr:uncharacterized protein FOA43_000429 [Brettanomyces nanus]QPG73124.1 hypothetical protein FOA43_000429 [Brettanomyces nanus]